MKNIILSIALFLGSIQAFSQTIFDPYLNEQVPKGDFYKIRWTYNHVVPANAFEIILVSEDSPGTYVIASAAPAVQDGKSLYYYDWGVLNSFPEGQYHIQITSDNGLVEILSDPFELVSNLGSPLPLYSPNGGEVIQIGSGHSISWGYSLLESTSFAIYLVDDQNAETFIAETPVYTPSGQTIYDYTWDVVFNRTGSFKIKVVPTIGGRFLQSENYFTLNPGDPLPLISPNGGETIESYQNQTVSWQWELTEPSSFQVYLVYDDALLGPTEDLIGETETFNPNGLQIYSFEWFVEYVADHSNHKIKIVPTNDSQQFESANTFDINYTNEMVFPLGGEVFADDQVITIKWKYELTERKRFQIYLISDQGAQGYIGLTDYYEVSEQGILEYTHSIGGDTDENWKIRINPYPATGFEMESGYFNFENQYDNPLPMVFPNGGEEVFEDELITIEWDYDLSVPSRFRLYRIEGGTMQIGETETYQPTGPTRYSFQWEVNADVNDTHRIRVVPYDEGGKYVESENTFSVISPLTNPFPMITPNGGEELTDGELYTLEWQYDLKEPSTFRVQRVRDDGYAYTDDYTPEFLPSGPTIYSFDYRVEGDHDEPYKIRLLPVEGGRAVESESPYTIIGPNDNPYPMIFPNGGEELTEDQLYTLKWQYNLKESTRFKVMSLRNGSYWSTLGYTDTFSPTGLTEYSFVWRAAYNVDDSFKIRIIPEEGGKYVESEWEFTIVSKLDNPYPMIFPNGGEELTEDELYTIQWEYDLSESQSFSIRTKRQDGYWHTIGTTPQYSPTGPTTYSYDWRAHDDVGDSFIFRISPTSGGKVVESASEFTIIGRYDNPYPLNYPNDGENILDDTEVTISWDYQLKEDTYFRIYRVSPTNGSANSIGSTQTYTATEDPVTYTYDWDINGNIGDYYKIRIIPQAGGKAVLSEEPFRLVNKYTDPYPLIAPNGGDKLTNGEEVIITWEYQIETPTSFNIYRTNSSGGSKVLIGSTGALNPAPNGIYTYSWTVDQGLSGSYKIQVEPDNDGIVCRSQELFDIYDEYYVTFPFGGEILDRSEDYVITWKDANYAGAFDVYLDNQSELTLLGSTGPIVREQDGQYSFPWTVPSYLDLGETYKIHIVPQLIGGGGTPIVSYDYFTIGHQLNGEYPLEYPNGGELIKLETSTSIKWQLLQSDLGSYYDVELLHGDGTSTYLGRYNGNPTANNGVYDFEMTWTPDYTLPEREDYKIRVVSSDDLVLQSQEPFALVDASVLLKNRVIFPNGGESLSHDKTYSIRWLVFKELDASFDIYLVDELGVKTTISEQFLSNHYNWLLPSSITPGNYKIEILSSNGRLYKSEDYFQICEECADPLTVDSPNGGEIFKVGDSFIIEWMGKDEYNGFDVSLVNDAGVETSVLIHYTGNTYSFNTIGLDPDFYKVKIHNNGRYDESNEYFLVTDQQTLNTIEAKGYTYDEVGNQITITNSKAFFDFNGGLLQSQSKQFTDGFIIANQPLYDIYGRSVGETLPAPIDFPQFQYKENFIENSSGDVYSYKDLLSDTPNKVKQSTNGTLGYYYSDNNSEEPNVAATDYPFSRVEFYGDGSGEVLRSSGPGDIFHEDNSKKSYSKQLRGNEDLLSIFPRYIGLRHKLTDDGAYIYDLIKTVTRDANGNEVVTFTDADGKVLASGFNYIEDSDNSVPYSGSVNVETGDTFDFHVGSQTSYTSKFSTNPKVFNLETGIEVVGSVLDPGFYRCFDCGHLSYDQTYYDMSFNFYDNMGRLRLTLSPNSKLEELDLGSLDLDNIPYATHYYYDHEGRLESMKEPDAGVTKYYYRNDGTLRFSQNAEQHEVSFAYTDYDDYGRPIESGVYTGPHIDQIISSDLEKIGYNSWSASFKEDWLKTYYDLPDPSPSVNLPAIQQFTYGAVSYTENENTKSWYSYDELGRVQWVATYYKDIFAEAKVIYYDYDFTGNVTRVSYQPSQTDQFYHAYTYDADGRLKDVYASEDPLDMTDLQTADLQASYLYYPHGPLRSVELANDLQSIDYYYTIQGWLKSINNPLNEVDPGFMDDVFAQSYTYFNGDYDRQLFPTYAAAADYTGNIISSHWNTYDPFDPMGASYASDQAIYSYDKKYQLTGANNGTDQKFKLDNLKYDPNGNILSLRRFDASETEKDNFEHYNYTDGNNQLESLEGTLNVSFEYDDLGRLIKKDGPDYVMEITLEQVIERTGYSPHSGFRKFVIFDALVDSDDPLAYSNIYRIYSQGELMYEGSGLPSVIQEHEFDLPVRVECENGFNTGEIRYHDLNESGAGSGFGISNYFDPYYDKYSNQSITYDQTGKVTHVETLAGDPILTNEYDDKGFRIRKIEHGQGGDKRTVYVRDASGGLLSIYTKDLGETSYTQDETPVYGGSRLGNWYHSSGDLAFELKDHLGNVRSIISKETRSVTYWADYYPFGSLMRSGGMKERYDYQGDFSEKDEETGWNHFEAREYDPVIGRWLSIDPAREFHSPYLANANNPIRFVDSDGKKIVFAKIVMRGGKPYLEIIDRSSTRYDEAYYHLKNHGASGLLDELESRQETVYLVETDDKNSRFVPGDNRIIYWDPTMGLKTTNGYYLSPSTVLVHEVDHALYNITNSFDQFWFGNQEIPSFDKVEEMRVIEGSELEVARKLGEIQDDEFTRFDHSGKVTETIGPTSNVAIWEQE